MIDNETLRKFFLFGDLSDLEVTNISQIITEEDFPPKSVLFEENEPGGALYLIVEGSVQIIKRLAKNKQKSLSMLKTGEFFGEMSLLDGEPRSASAVTQEGCKCLKISREHFLNFLDQHPRTAFKFFTPIIKVFSKRLRDNNEHFRDLLVWYLKKETTPK